MKNLIRNVWVCLGLMVLPFTASGQQKDNITYVPAQELLLVGKATTEGGYFHRVDTAKYCTMPPTVKKLFTNSAGLAISFTTNSPVIKAKWMVPDNYQLPNLTRVAERSGFEYQTGWKMAICRSRDTRWCDYGKSAC